MRTPITLQEFLFTLNQDEDMLVTIINYDKDEVLFKDLWKSGLNYRSNFLNYCTWFVQDFILSRGGLEITIVKSEIELD
jgi:hypothetical protein